MVEHLRDLHSQVQALRDGEADVADGAVAHQAANAQTTTQVAALCHAREGVQGGGLAAAQGPGAGVAPSARLQQTVQGTAEETSQEDGGAVI